MANLWVMKEMCYHSDNYLCLNVAKQLEKERITKKNLLRC